MFPIDSLQPPAFTGRQWRPVCTLCLPDCTCVAHEDNKDRTHPTSCFGMTLPLYLWGGVCMTL